MGFTLQYEMSYTNILEMLDLAGIPLRGAARGQADPIVIAGGPCAFNPEPLHAFIDAFVIGDGEEATLEVIDAVRASREKGETRAECLRALAGIPGVYVPSLYVAAYHPDGALSLFAPRDPAAPLRVQKRVMPDLDKAYYPREMIVPYMEIVHDRVMLEVMRGCTRGCRFCQAGMLYRPVRERSLQSLVDAAQALIDATGYEEISLSSLSTGDFSCLPELARELTDRFEKQRVSLSLPSLRVDSVLGQALAQKIRKSSLTFAPEAGTQRLRDVINKGVTQEDLIRSVRDAFENGYSSVKLYFMIGLPTETYEDLDGIAELAKAVTDVYFSIPKGQRAPGLRVLCSASCFVPKPFTPFQWARQDTMEELAQKQRYLREKLRLKGVTFNWHEPDLSYLEACFARGDRRVADVLEAAWRGGCRFDGWSELFRFDAWLKAFESCGLSPAFYANRERPRSEVLPWQCVDAGITEQFLWREKLYADQEQVTPDCRNGCQGCGLQRWEGVCGIAHDRPI